MRCAIYTRVSTAEQGREGASLPVQLQACRQYAAGQGWTVADELQDIQSGLDTDRAAYQRAIGLARSHDIEAVLVWRLDRFGRDEAEAMIRLKEMARLQVRVVSATEGDQSPFHQRLMFLLAGEESRRTSERVRPALRKRVEEGLWVVAPPFGYRMDPGHKGRLVIHEPEADVVREMYRRCTAGESTYAIANWLNTLTTPEGSRLLSPRGKWFVPRFVADVLRNPAYIGMIRWNRSRNSKIDGRRELDVTEHTCVPGQHLPLIDREAYDLALACLANTAMGNRAARVHRRFLLTGMIRCGECDRAMCGQRMYDPARSSYYRYRCEVRHHASAHGPKTDLYILTELAALPMPDNAIGTVRGVLNRQTAALPDRAGDLRAQRQRHEERRKRLTLLLADGSIELIDYRAAIANVVQAIATVDREIVALVPQVDTTGQMEEIEAWITMAREMGSGTMAAVIQAASLDDQAALVASAIERVKILRDQDPIVTWRPWVETLRLAAVGTIG